MPDATLIIPTKNAGPSFKSTLERIFSQKYAGSYEVLVVDSGSKDGTVKTARDSGARVMEIKPEEFGHGKTRNFAARNARGRKLIFTTQDAIPADDRWLQRLSDDLDDPSVAGVYGRQIPKEDALPMERFFLNTRYLEKGETRRASPGAPLRIEDVFFSNVNSAVKRGVFLKIPFREDLIISEDMQWAKDALTAGYAITYDPDAAVIHSHNYNLIMVFRRYFDSGTSFDQMRKFGGFSPHVFKGGMNYLGREIEYMRRNGYQKWIPQAILYNISKFLGVTIGKKYWLLPRFARRMCSSNGAYWR